MGTHHRYDKNRNTYHVCFIMYFSNCVLSGNTKDHFPGKPVSSTSTKFKHRYDKNTLTYQRYDKHQSTCLQFKCCTDYIQTIPEITFLVGLRGPVFNSYFIYPSKNSNRFIDKSQHLCEKIYK